MTLKELRALKAKKMEAIQALTQTVQTEKRSMTADEITQFDTHEQSIESLTREIRAKEITPSNVVAKEIHGVDDKEIVAFRNFLRTSERRDSTGNSNNTNADGKFVNPDAFSNELFKEITTDNGILSLCRTMSVSSDVLNFPTVDDTVMGSATGTPGDIKQDPELKTIEKRKLAIANVKIDLNTYAIETIISNQLRDDNAVNLESVIAELGSAGIARNASRDVFVILDAGITIADSAVSGAIDYTDLVTLLGSVNGTYYAKGEFLMSQAKFISILGLLDTNKRPIIQMPIEKGLKPSLFGKPITIDDNAKDQIYFGDFSTLILAQNTNTNTLVDIYSLSSDLATKYVTSARMGSGVLSGKAIAGLKAKV